MRKTLTAARKIATRCAPATVAVASAAFALGTYSGHAAARLGTRSGHHTFTLVLRTKAVRLETGSADRLRIGIRRRGLRGPIGVRVVSRLPRGISARLAPVRTSGNRATLTVRASTSARLGRYRVRVRARAGHVRRAVVLIVSVFRSQATQSSSPQPPDFSITGSAARPLEPGQAQPVDVRITNPNGVPLSLASLTSILQSVTAPRATAALPCPGSDFTVQPYSGPLPLTIPASSSRSLSGLGVPSSQWPQLLLVNRPTDQDGCQGASLSLAYSADGRLG
jgi:hypothetical protein